MSEENFHKAVHKFFQKTYPFSNRASLWGGLLGIYLFIFPPRRVLTGLISPSFSGEIRRGPPPGRYPSPSQSLVRTADHDAYSKKAFSDLAAFFLLPVFSGKSE